MSNSQKSAQTALSKKVKSGSKKGFDPELLRRAEETLEDAKSNFGVNAQGELQSMMTDMNTVLKTEAGNDTRAKALAGVSMCAHELRGQGGTFGYNLLTSVCASMYYFAKAVDINNVRHLAVLELHADSVRLILNDQLSGDGGDKGAELLQGLKEAVEKVMD